MKLPVLDKAEQILKDLQEFDRIIINSPTGSGKSTALPKFLNDSGILVGKILVVQPRQIAAKMLARRVAHLYNEKVGQRVGYQVRFDRCIGADTNLIYITQGILLRMMQSNYILDGVGAVILDEFHERNLEMDMALALIKELQYKHGRKIKLMVMSATLDTNALYDFLNPVTQVVASGFMYPVEIIYAGSFNDSGKYKKPVWEKAVYALKRYQQKLPDDGNILIFMPGQFEIQKTIQELNEMGWGKEYDLFPLYGNLSVEAQDRAVNPCSKKKIIVSTNIAETSLTIEGIHTVVDSGLVKLSGYDAGRGINTLMTQKISQASAKQRAGRAGRMCEGLCIRLWSQNEQDALMQHSPPEVTRVELSDPILSLLSMGTKDIRQFEWFQSPELNSLEQAMGLLETLGAISGNELTEIGSQMARLPMHPRFSRMLIQVSSGNSPDLTVFFVAMMQERDFLLKSSNSEIEKRRMAYLDDAESSDIIYRFLLWEAARLKSFDRRFCDELGLHQLTCKKLQQSIQQIESIFPLSYGVEKWDEAVMDFKSALIFSFYDHLAIRQTRGTLRYVMPDGKSGELRRESCSRREDILICCERAEMDKKEGVSVFLSMATPIQIETIEKAFPHEWKRVVETEFYQKEKRVRSVEKLKFKDWVIKETELEKVSSSDKAASLLADQVISGSLKIQGLNNEIQEFKNRVAFVAYHFPEFGISPIREDDERAILIIAFEDAWSYKEIKKMNLLEAFESWLSAEQLAALNYYAPRTIQLTSRAKPFPIRYKTAEAIISAKVQELYDVPQEMFSIGDGRVALKIEILAPNYRPVQVTHSIKSFWENSYEQIKKDLKGRYPKHEWR